MRAIAEQSRLKFSELFEGATSRTEVVVTFLALLELIRLKQIMAIQAEAFGEIQICAATTPPGPFTPPAETGAAAVVSP